MQRICRLVLGVGLLLAGHLRGLSATSVEDLLSTQDAQEATAHSDFAEWCRAAQSKLADRVSFQKERIDELNGAIASYAEKVGELRNATKKGGGQPLDLLSQDQRLKLIQTESEHWRSVHAKEAAERLLKGDKDLLQGVESALQWEDQTLSHHQAAREQLLALVRAQHIQASIEAPPRPAAPVVVAAAPPVPEASGENLMPTASLRKPQPLVPHVLPQAKFKKRSLKTMSPIRPGSPPVAGPSAPVVVHELAPVFGISQLPALQLMQAGAVPSQFASPQFSALQGESHPVPPPSPAASTEQLLAPMLPKSPPVEMPSINPLLSLAGMNTANAAQVTALSEIGSSDAVAPEASPGVPEATAVPEAAFVSPVVAVVAAVIAPAVEPVVVPAATPVAPEAPVEVAQAEPVVVPAKAPAAPAEPAAAAAAPVVLAETPAVPETLAAPAVPVAAVAAPVPQKPSPVATNLASTVAEALPLPAAAAPVVKDTAPEPSPVAPNLASTVEQALPLPAAAPEQPAAKATKPVTAFVQSAGAPSAPAKKAESDKDPEDALMALMMGSPADSPEVEAPAHPQSKPKAPAAKVAPSKKAATAFLSVKETPIKAAPAAVEDPEDALMEKMMQTSAEEAAGEAPPPAHVLALMAQTAQPVHSAQASLRTTAKKASVKAHHPQPAKDSEAGVMQSFIQEVSNLGQGEPGSSQVDPAAPVKEKQEEETQESEAHMMSSFVQEVSQLAQGEPSPAEATVTAAPTTASGMALSGDLASLMGLGTQAEPASFLQVASHGKQRRRVFSRSEMAAASLIKDLDASEVSKRLARTVSQSSVDSNVQMLTALNEQLQARQLKWTCSKGQAAGHSMAVLQLAETGTSLLMAERDTVASLSSELRDSQAESAQLRAEFVTLLEQTLGRGYDAAGKDLEGLPLAQIRSESPVGASAFIALENALKTDAAAAKQLGSKWVDSGAEYVRLGDELLQTSTSKDQELKKAQRVLWDARSRATAARSQVAKEEGCADAVRTSGLIAAVYKALHILSD